MPELRTNVDINEFLKDPERGIHTLIADLREQMRRRKVSEDAIEGMSIALQIAFNLGENSAALKIARGQKR
jgi:hypothetical protein